jgi:GNAT superfamily N-acetyltransferase
MFCAPRLDWSRLVHTAVVIRLGMPADYAAVAAVYRRASLSNAGDRENLLAHPRHLILEPDGLAQGRTHVADEHGIVVGFASWVDVEDSGELEDLFVEPSWMRRGVATALVGCIVDVLRAQGVPCLEVTANPHALGFYRAVGFSDIGTASTQFGAAPRMTLPIQ